MRLGVLGTLLVVDDAGGERVITAPRQRTLLAALLVHANRVVPIEELAGFVWDGTPPAGAARTLRSYVMRLRQTLGPDVSARILTRAPGYVFQASEDELDLLSFRARGRAAAEALRAEAWPDAAGMLAEALDLWRGAALADVESDLLRREHVEYLEQERLQAAEWRTEAELGLGHHVRLLPQLRAAAIEHPLREHGHAQLMLALYRSGRVAEALEAYQQARRALVGELGVEPGQELQELQRRILDGDPSLALSLRPAAAAPAAAAATLGYRHGLPPDTAAFTGRDAELELITASVTGAEPGGVVAIRAIGGMPGVGKTALAVHAAHRLTGAFTDRQLFIDLHGHTQGRDPVSAEDALAGLLAAAGVDARFLPADLAGRAALWRDKMTGQRALLVLDNAASSAQVAPLLPGDGCLVLVTSRRHLADLPGAVIPVSVDTLPPGQARAMFIRLAPRGAGQDPVLIDELTALAGHLPLAVSLLARVFAHHPSWTLADLIAETRGSLLTLAAEHASVAAAFDVSWRHLRPAAQGFLALLGLHPGTSVDSYAAAAMADAPVPAAADLLDELHREGLLTETGYRRYHMHDLIRSYASAQAGVTVAAGERQAALERLLGYYTRAAARVDALISGRADGRPDADLRLPGLADAPEALAWARAERANLLACLDHATAAGWDSEVVTLTSASARLLRHDGPWTEAEARHAAAAEAARRLGDDARLAHALLDLGVVRRLAGDYRGAGDVLTTALGIHRGLGDRPGLAAVRLELAHVSMLVDAYPAAVRSAGQALELYRETGDRLGQAGALILLGSIRRMTDDAPAAFSALTLALAICSDLGDRSGQAHALRELGDVHRLTGDYPAALANLTEALSLSRELDDRLGQANALTWLGGVRRVTGDYPSALADLEQALTIQQALDNKNGQANALVLLGDIRQAIGDYQAAARDLEQALLLFRDLGSPAGQANVLNWLGNLRRASGDYPAAAASLAEALALCRDVGDRGGQATALNGIGELHRAQGEIASAEASHREALDLSRQIASPWDEAHALAGLARCARATGDLPGATSLLTQAHEIFHRMGAAETPEIAAELASIPTTG